MSKLVRLDKNENLKISYGVATCIFADCLIAWCERNICFLGFTGTKSFNSDLQQLKNTWPHGDFTEDKLQAQHFADLVFSNQFTNDLLVCGSDFQVKVWETIISVGVGQTLSYQALADMCFGPNYTRAVASAVAGNNISYLIACHRIIRKSGNINRYRWGTPVKKALLEYEQL